MSCQCSRYYCAVCVVFKVWALCIHKLIVHNSYYKYIIWGSISNGSMLCRCVQSSILVVVEAGLINGPHPLSHSNRATRDEC